MEIGALASENGASAPTQNKPPKVMLSRKTPNLLERTSTKKHNTFGLFLKMAIQNKLRPSNEIRGKCAISFESGVLNNHRWVAF